MIRIRSTVGPLRRLALLAGVLLHLAGAAAVPAFHAWAEAASPPAELSVRPDGGEPAPDRPAHDELTCVLCHATAQAAIPAGGGSLALASGPAPDLPPAPIARPASAPASPANARAPPRRS